MSKSRYILSLAVNVYLFLSTLIITLSNLLTTRPPDSHTMGFRGVENLMYYTVDSNILMSLCAVVILIFLVKEKRKASLPVWLHIVTLSAAVSVGVTFATVAFFLSPGQAMMGRGYFSLFTGNNLFLHLLNPLLGCIDFILLIPGRRYKLAECLYGIIPTAVYGTVYTISVVFTRTWPDIYNFTFGGHFNLAPIPLITILAMSFGISVLLTRLHNYRLSRRNS